MNPNDDTQNVIGLEEDVKNEIGPEGGIPQPSAESINTTAIIENPAGGSPQAKESAPVVDSHQDEDASKMDEIREKLHEIAGAKPVAKWNTYLEGKQYGVVITLPQESTITGTLNVSEDGSRSMYVDIFGVNKEMQGKGIGARLLRSLSAEAVSYGATTLNGHVTSESALRTRARVFGGENLQFYNHTTGDNMNLSYEDALKVKPDFNVVVDLTKVDTTDWERPQRDNN